MHKFPLLHNIDLSMYETCPAYSHKHIHNAAMNTKSIECKIEIYTIEYEQRMRKSIKKAGPTNQTCSVSNMQT